MKERKKLPENYREERGKIQNILNLVVIYIAFLLKCDTRSYERGTKWKSNSLAKSFLF